MSKFLRISIVILAVFVMTGFAGKVSAAGPTGLWASGISCVNLDSGNVASITLIFYQQDNSTSVLTYSDTILAGGNKNYFTTSTPPGIPASFTGSAVIESTTPISCNVNTQKQSAGTLADPYRIGTSGALGDNIGPNAYAPQVMRNYSGWNSYIAVQNTTLVDSSVTITYKSKTGANVPAATETVSIPGQASHIFYQNDNTGLGDNFIGAATISSVNGTTSLAVVVNFYNSGSNNTTSQFHSYNGFTSGASSLFIPRFVRTFYGYNGGLTIQNIGGGDTTIKITFNFAGNSYVYNSGVIASGASLALYAPDITQLAPVDLLPTTNHFGSALVEVVSGGPIVAIVNEDNRGGVGVPVERIGQGSTYNAILGGSETNIVFFAQVPRSAGGVFSGGFQISNTTGNVGSCDIVYTNVPAANQTLPLPANGSISVFAPNVPNLPDGFNAGVTATCTQPVVGISNLAVVVGSGRYGDSFTQTTGLNK
jgi:hypothetical protein